MKTLKWLLAICLVAIMFSAFVTAKKSSVTIKLADSSGYQVDTLVKNMKVPWQIVFLPDNTMLFTERTGKLRIYRNGKLVDKPAFIIPNIPQRNKTGMLGMVLHPDFIHNHFIYIANDYWLGDKIRLQIVRYEFRNDTLLNHSLSVMIFMPIKIIPVAAWCLGRIKNYILLQAMLMRLY